MAASKKQKVNKNPDTVKKDVIAIIIVLIIIAGYVFVEVYRATHIDVETIKAVTSTVYDTIETKALVVRREILSLVGSGIESVFFLYLNVSFDDGCRELIHRLRNAQCDNLLKIVFVVVQ